MQIQNTLDWPSVKNIGISVGKTIGSAVVASLFAWLGSNVTMVAGIFKNPDMVLYMTVVLRGIITLYTQYKSGQIQA